MERGNKVLRLPVDSLDSNCQARQPRHTPPYMYSCRAWTKSQEGMSSIVGIWCNPGELRASEDVCERAVWHVYVRHTFPFDFDKKVK